MVLHQRRVSASAAEPIVFDGPSSVSAHISFDPTSGIPTIAADSYQAAMAGLGYAQASQRLFQTSNGFDGRPITPCGTPLPSVPTAGSTANGATATAGSAGLTTPLMNPSRLVTGGELAIWESLLGKMNAALPNVARVMGGPASNNWAIAGKYTTTGKAKLANDRHLSFATSTLTYLAKLVWPDESIDAVVLPGVPGMIPFVASHSDGTVVSAGVIYALAESDGR
jgi:acyl-homoserine lactone acylase PvdQ